MIEVREARPEDAGAVEEINTLAIAELRKTYRPKKRALAIRAGFRSELRRIVAAIDGQVVGTTEYLRHGDRIHIVGLGVHPDCRRMGAARRLIEYLAGIAEREGVPALSLNTVRETGNVAIFSRLGFETISECPDDLSESDVHESLTDVYMERVVG